MTLQLEIILKTFFSCCSSPSAVQNSQFWLQRTLVTEVSTLQGISEDVECPDKRKKVLELIDKKYTSHNSDNLYHTFGDRLRKFNTVIA